MKCHIVGQAKAYIQTRQTKRLEYKLAIIAKKNNEFGYE